MRVSVIIPVHDRAAMALEAVASVLAQSHADLELTVVDDGSTDDLAGRLAGIADPRLRALRQENKGVAAARNAGIAASSGPLIALLDSDDLWLPDKLSRQLAFLRQTGHEICQCQEIWMRDGRRVNPRRRHLKQDGDFFERALKLCLVSPSSVLFTRRLWREIGPFDESLPACEDYDFWLRVLVTRPVGLLDEYLVVRRGGRPDQLSSRFTGMDLFRIRSLAKLLDRDDLDDWRRDCIKRELAEKTRVYVQGCQKRGRLDEAGRVAEMVRRLLGEAGA